MGIFERYLTIWVLSALGIGQGLGIVFPHYFSKIATFEYEGINLVIAVLIWAMILPMMLQIDFTKISNFSKNPRGLFLTLAINWLIKPFSMFLIASLFMGYVFSAYIPYETAQSYVAGMILLGVAPCTAMVFVWSYLMKGDANFTLVQVSINDLIMLIAFAPIAGFLLQASDIVVPYKTLFTSVFLFIVLPLILSVGIRHYFRSNIIFIIQKLKPLSIISLLLTILILFGLQSNNILGNFFHMGLIAIPLIIQTYLVFYLGYYISRKIKLTKSIAGPACLIGTSNFFELAVVVAITLFGLNSPAALATIVGVLVEVPVMLHLVNIINKKYKQC
ncbi:MAG: ACR3 family arsenite efflux transporter [Proteobacteria bacterium]|nr:ACR3 family arsenite efflux transporter [Pseudomonadota bacterium]